MLGGILYLSLSIRNKSESVVNSITIEGNEHLSVEQYLSFANLSDKNTYTVLSLKVIKDRLEKHPYIEHADVRYNGAGKVSIKIIEKVFECLLLKKEEHYLLTDRLQILPILPQTKKIDIPVIFIDSLTGGSKFYPLSGGIIISSYCC